MQQEDLRQIQEIISNSLVENNRVLEATVIKTAIKEALLENNKILEAKIDESMAISKESFDEIFKRLDNVENRLDGVESGLKEVKDLNQNIYSRMVEVTDNQMKEMQLDNDKIKFLHIDEWKKLPPTGEISNRLIEEGMKFKAA